MVRAIHLTEVQQLLESGAQLVDVLPPREYRDLHLKGAINIPLKQLNRQTAAKLDRERAIIVYCYDYQ